MSLNERVSSIGTNLLLSIIYMLFILSIAALFTLNFRPLYYFDVERLHIENRSGLTKEEIKQNYDALIDYNSFFNKEPLTLPTLAMSEKGRIHFEDVKRIFDAIFILCVTTLVLGVLGTINHVKNKQFLFLKLTSLLTLVLPFLVGILIAIIWDKVFVTFHKLFFQNDYWQFDAKTDPIINILPDTFFLHCAILILFVMILGSALCGLAYFLLKRKRPLS